MTTDHMRRIVQVEVVEPFKLNLLWSDGARAVVDLSKDVLAEPFRSLSEPSFFRQVQLDDWGHAVEWPDGTDIGASSLWRDTLTLTGRDDARQILDWRLRNGLSLANAAEALGLTRRQMAQYSNGDKPVPKAILLALRGWEALQAA